LLVCEKSTNSTYPVDTPLHNTRFIWPSKSYLEKCDGLHDLRSHTIGDLAT